MTLCDVLAGLERGARRRGNGFFFYWTPVANYNSGGWEGWEQLAPVVYR